MTSQITFFIRAPYNAHVDEFNTLYISNKETDEIKEDFIIDFNNDENIYIKETSYSHKDIDTFNCGTIQMSIAGLKLTKLRFIKADGANDLSSIVIKLQKEDLNITLGLFEADKNKAEQLYKNIEGITTNKH